MQQGLKGEGCSTEEEQRDAFPIEDSDDEGDAGVDAPKEEISNETVYVGNLSFNTDADKLREFFGPCGSIKDVTIMKKTDGSSRGFAHIEFDNVEGAEKAMGYVGRELDERKLNIGKVTEKVRNGGRKGLGSKSKTVVDKKSKTVVDKKSKTVVDKKSKTVVESKSKTVVESKSKTIVDSEGDRGSSSVRGGDRGRGSSIVRGGDSGRGSSIVRGSDRGRGGSVVRGGDRGGSSVRGGKPEFKCYNCYEEGHGAKECPEPRRDGGKRPVLTCYNCQGEGHGAKECTEPSKPREDGKRGGRGGSRGGGNSRGRGGKPGEDSEIISGNKKKFRPVRPPTEKKDLAAKNESPE